MFNITPHITLAEAHNDMERNIKIVTTMEILLNKQWNGVS